MESVAAAVFLHVERLPAKAGVATDPRSKVNVVREQLRLDLTCVVQPIEKGNLRIVQRQERAQQVPGLVDESARPLLCGIGGRPRSR